MIRIKSIAIICVLALCAGCGSHPEIDRLSESSIIVAFGDSLTSGSGATKTENYPSILSEMTACRVVNSGVPGETTSEGLRRLPAVLKKEHPDLVILCHGGNDLLKKQDPSITIANLNTMIAMTKKAGADIILIGVPKPGLRLKPPPFYKKIATKHDLPIDMKTIPKILSTPALKSDYIHPNATGYRMIAASVATMIRESQRE